MNEEKILTNESEIEELPFLHPRQDLVLQNLSYSANVDGLRLPITLQVGGLLVTGILVGHDAYMRAASQVCSGFVDDTDEEKFENWKKITNVIFPISAEKPPEDLKFESVRMIHLIEARIFAGRQTIPSGGPGVAWRGPLAAVDGFFLGEIEVASRE